ncbi:branched-chain amino acid ABC transporter permease [Phaeacidiphilus oryzae]|uniref:branched-chain amino acid ABC transporter permease n=1 Tax=Phaeacidiphilus oryzae TaxID=348818 RepID=UPI0005647AC4|nr:branched-chain amino acid ABC transporter permease [Phaeacidiphilus oryzae]
MTDINATDATTAAPAAGAPARPVLPLPPSAARAIALVGAVATAASAWLAWTWTSAFPGDLTVSGYPGGLQWETFVAGLLAAVYALAGYGGGRIRGLAWLNPARGNAATLLLATGALATTWYTLIAIAAELGGLANLTAGGWVAGAGSLVCFLGALGLPASGRVTALGSRGRSVLQRLTGQTVRPAAARPLPTAAEYLIILVMIALALLLFAYGIDTSYGELFVGFLITVAFAVWALNSAGLTSRWHDLYGRHQAWTLALCALAAVAFPFTQNNDHDANVGVNILIFATVALGLNIVVGLTGLLDLGYVAFLGVGAYAAALVSGSPYSSIHGTTFPFWAAALTGAAASLLFGVLIGAPTLRLRGDYLAIVTLGFGEIFRITVQNLDGTSGPDVTNGPNGIPQIPDLSIFGFNLGMPHQIGSFTLGRFANYYLLMVLATVFVIAVFSRAANSRIGRAWVAIREDETAALAMGINGFRVKLTAFALGACLAGLAGTVSAHVTYNVVPDPYQFAGPVAPNSAFLLAAVVLGGMGTIGGPVLGAALLYLIPEKLQFLQDYKLLAFGLALVLIMRFRPEGIIANRRRQLEFHESGAPPVTAAALPAQPAAATPAPDDPTPAGA